MAEFRKSFLLAAMAVAVGVGTASAQNLSPSCVNAPSAAPYLRSEGQTELTGAIVLNCTNIAVGQSVNIDVLLNGGAIPITSRETPVSEATLTVTPSPGALVTYPGTYVATTPNQPVNDVRFLGVATTTTNLQITITGIRANVNPTYVPLSNNNIGTVLATVTASNGVLPIQVTGGGLFVGLVTPGLGQITSGSGFTISGCQGAPPLSAGSNFVISIPELFPTAFKPQGPIANQDSETGQNVAALQAESGTQFAVTFNNIPAGLTFYIPQTITSLVNNAPSPGLAELVAVQGSTLGLTGPYILGSDPALNLTGSFPLGAANNFYAVTNGTTVFYNVDVANPSAIDTFQIPTYLSGTPSSPSTAAPTVLVTLAPQAIVNGVQQINVPRFIALSSTPYNLPGFSITGCQTTLLFPYMTNLAGFDTGFSIAATSADPFGTFVQGGTCTISLYGVGLPSAPPTLVVPPSGEGHTTISTIAPGFQGYVIATCPFEYAHGYAFLSNGFSGVGNGGLSEGYLALEIGNTRGGTPSTAANNVSGGESLGH